MTYALYQPALKLVLAHEGGFVNHPKDPGGATNKGITQAVYDGYRRANGLAVRSVLHILDSEVAAIYRNQYASKIMFDKLPAGLDYAMFDFAVNSGVRRCVEFMQRIVKVNDVDGVMGYVTLGQIKEECAKNELDLIDRLCSERMAFLKRLNTFPTFGKGWTRRVLGSQPGAQDNDHGVIDYAHKFAKADLEYTMPAPVGTKPGEVAGKALSQPTEASYLPARPLSYAELKAGRWKD